MITVMMNLPRSAVMGVRGSVIRSHRRQDNSDHVRVFVSDDWPSWSESRLHGQAHRRTHSPLPITSEHCTGRSCDLISTAVIYLSERLNSLHYILFYLSSPPPAPRTPSTPSFIAPPPLLPYTMRLDALPLPFVLTLLFTVDWALAAPSPHSQPSSRGLHVPILRRELPLLTDDEWGSWAKRQKQFLEDRYRGGSSNAKRSSGENLYARFIHLLPVVHRSLTLIRLVNQNIDSR